MLNEDVIDSPNFPWGFTLNKMIYVPPSQLFAYNFFLDSLPYTSNRIGCPSDGGTRGVQVDGWRW
jgi:hypothetical protein